MIPSLNVVVDVGLIVELGSVNLLALRLLFVLMDEREANIVFKLGNSEVKLHISQFGVLIQLFKDAFSESSNDRLFIISDDIREELVDEFDFEVCQVETSVVVAVELVSQVKNYLIFFRLFSWVEEFVDQPV